MVRHVDKCTVSDCDRVQECRNLCKTHWQQQHAGIDPRPIRTYIKTHKDQDGRVCTGCMQYKPWNDYYGKTRAKCKQCMIKINGEINQRRNSA